MRKIENSKVLVTGGAGFIGSNLVDALLEQNNLVVVLDNFATGREFNLEHIYDFSAKKSLHKNFILIRGDIRNAEDCQLACHGVDFVLHQAALGSVPRSIDDPVTTNAVNIGGFVNMLVAARDAGVRRFVYAASSSTYGDHPGLPKVEDVIGKPLSPYAVSKYVNELYADVFGRQYNMECIGLRYFNVFGRRQDPDGAYAAVIPKFVASLMKSEAIVINGDGGTSRDFTYIDNVIQLNQLAALTQNPAALNTVYNCACGGNVSLNQLFETLKCELSRYQPSVVECQAVYGSERAGDVRHSQASIAKAESLLGFEPSHSFEAGIRECVAWYASHL